MKLIKSSIYSVNGIIASYTGENEGGLPVFSAHGQRIVGGAIKKVGKEEIAAYFGR